jgi:hypothetical protein
MIEVSPIELRPTHNISRSDAELHLLKLDIGWRLPTRRELNNIMAVIHGESPTIMHAWVSEDSIHSVGLCPLVPVRDIDDD